MTATSAIRRNLMPRPYEPGGTERANKGNAIVTLADEENSGRDQFDSVQRRDDLAADYDLLQIVAIAERLVIEKPKPKIGAEFIHFCRSKESWSKHGNPLKQRTCHGGLANADG